jgi:GPH family glycoside/pentoside/hexuronide:cation symporter
MLKKNTDNGKSSSKEKSFEYSTGKILSYTSAWTNDALATTLFSVSLFYYYEVEIGLSIGLVALAFGIFAVWNAINDPLIAFFTEKPRSEKSIKKYGFRTPWILLGAFSMSIFTLLIFLPPDIDVKTNPWPVFLYMVITICILDACVTIYNSNYTASVVTMFKTDAERRKIGALALIFGIFGIIIISAILIPNIVKFGNKQSFVIAALITMIFILLNSIAIIPGHREPEIVKGYYLVGRDKSKEAHLSLIKTLKIAFRKKNFVIYLFSYFLWVVVYNLHFVSQLYFVKDVLGEEASVLMFPQIAFFIGFLLAIPLWLKLAKKYGHANLYGLGYILLGFVFLTYLWISTVLELIIYLFVGGIFYAASAVCLVPVISDAYDEITATSGIHQEATLQGITNFFFRFSYLIVAVIIALVHIITAYNPDPQAIQSPIAILGIRIHTGLINAILCFIAGIVFLLVFDLKGEKKLLIIEELKKKSI